MSPKNIIIFFALIFVGGVLTRIFVSPILWPDVPEIVDPLRIILSSSMVGLMLSVIYYLKVHGSPKQVRLFRIVSLGLSIGFPFAFVGILMFRAIVGSAPDFSFILLYFAGFAIGAFIGNGIDKKGYRCW
ncbi:hypothetical protein MUO71_05365 [Candidatus Bathyarchaeota archaeon]|nr:hypothetical protein [Candidatus Bathyarchaeota archaeon]